MDWKHGVAYDTRTVNGQDIAVSAVLAERWFGKELLRIGWSVSINTVFWWYSPAESMEDAIDASIRGWATSYGAPIKQVEFDRSEYEETDFFKRLGGAMSLPGGDDE